MRMMIELNHTTNIKYNEMNNLYCLKSHLIIYHYLIQVHEEVLDYQINHRNLFKTLLMQTFIEHYLMEFQNSLASSPKLNRTKKDGNEQKQTTCSNSHLQSMLDHETNISHIDNSHPSPSSTLFSTLKVCSTEILILKLDYSIC